MLSRFGCNIESARTPQRVRSGGIARYSANRRLCDQSAPSPILGHSPLGIVMEQSAAKHIICHVNDICDVSDGVGAGIGRSSNFSRASTAVELAPRIGMALRKRFPDRSDS